MRLVDEMYTRGAQIRYVTRTYVWVSKRRVLDNIPQAVERFAVLIR